MTAVVMLFAALAKPIHLESSRLRAPAKARQWLKE